MQRRQPWTLITLGLVAASFTASAAAQEKLAPPPAVAGPARPEDEKAIRAAGAAFRKAFDAGDAKALAARFTADADYVDEEGHVLRGREAIEKEFAKEFLRQPGMVLETTVDSLRFLGAEAAVQSGVARIKPAAGGRGTATRFTLVLVKRGDQWLVENVRESPYVPESNYEHLRELEWLIGTWTADAGHATAEVKCEWATNRNFMIRTVTMKQGAGVLGTVTQVIGWDPALQQVRSWTFDSDGGFGAELWAKDGKRWVLEATGTRRDGGRTQATNVLIPAGTDSFTWQSVARRVAGVRLPDTAALKVHRVKDKK